MSFSTDPTRKLAAGDTPNTNDEQVSRRMAAENIAKGQACVVIAGVVTIATNANAANDSPFVPTESKDNSSGSAGDLDIEGVTPDQMVALKAVSGGAAINPDQFVKISATAGEVALWVAGTDASNLRYARYVGKEAGVFSKASATPYTESLSTGVIPDAALAATEIGWFKLVEAQ